MKTSLTYDETKREAVIRFSGGRELTIGNVTREQAARFFDRHAPELERRDCILQTAGAIYSRRA